MTEKKTPVLSAEDALLELDTEIQKDRKSIASARKWRRRAATVAGTAFLLCGPFRFYPPAILVLVPAVLVGAGIAIASHFRLKDKEEDLDRKYDRQAQLIIAVEAARKGGPEAKQALDRKIAAEFADVSVVERLEKAVHDLKDLVDGPDNDNKTAGLGKAAPGKTDPEKKDIRL